jgi:hypothetical protein
MFRAKFFATAAAYCFTVYASLSISSAMGSNEDLVWEIIDASGMVAGMEVAASEGLKAGIAPIAQQSQMVISVSSSPRVLWDRPQHKDHACSSAHLPDIV